MHAPCAQVPPLGQARSQAPQCAGLLFVSAQASPHSVCPEGQPHFESMHGSIPGHCTSQLPQ